MRDSSKSEHPTLTRAAAQTPAERPRPHRVAPPTRQDHVSSNTPQTTPAPKHHLTQGGDIQAPSQDVLLARQRIDRRFEVVRPLGQGGMGSVYLAKDVVLERNVAIKTLRTDHLDVHQREHWLQTFRREATLIARLQHPHIVTLHDFGLHEGIPFMVLEYLQGHALSTLLRPGPLSLHTTIPLACQLTQALSHAHARGVIHRDLKPSNLFIDANHQLKVMDFGVALLKTDRQCLAEDLGTDLQTLERRLGHTPDFAGTPLYMAPEQLRGEAIDARADLWALGVLLFEMLTGQRPPLHHMEVVDASIHRLQAVDTPPAIIALIRSCLQRDPNKRLTTAHNAFNILSDIETLPQTFTPAAFASPRTHLVRRSDTFVGRHHELQALAKLMARGTRLVNVLGPSGCGKTRLAEEFAHHVRANYDRSFFCELSDAQSTHGILAAVAHALDVPLTNEDAAAQLSHALAGHGHVLLIFDNVEHLVEPIAPLLTLWLRTTPQTTFIITSQHPLELTQEQKFHLDPLPLPDHALTTPHLIGQSDAVKLFTARASKHAPAFRMTSRNAVDIAALVRALDGLPLAIELAAARSRMVTPAQMLAKMHRRFDILRSTRRDLTPRSLTLHGALEWSWNLLTPWEQTTLAQASLFEGGFSLEAAEAVISLDAWPEAPFVIEALTSLVDKNLLRVIQPEIDGVSIESRRFSLLVSIQAFANAKLDRADQIWPDDATRLAVQGRHADFYAQLGSDHLIDTLERQGDTLLARTLPFELDNLITASRFSLAHARTRQACALLNALSFIFSRRGPFHAGVEELSFALEHQGLTDPQRATLLLRRGQLHSRTSNFTAARQDLTHAEELVTCPALHMDILSSLAKVDFYQSRLSDALSGHQRTMALARSAQDRRREGISLSHAAFVQLLQGHVDDAEEHFQRALHIARQYCDRHAELQALSYLAYIMQHQHRLEETRDMFLQALKLARELGDRHRQASCIGSLALLDRQLGDYTRARQGNVLALRLSRELGDQRLAGMWLGNLAVVDRHQGHLTKALEGYREALQIAQDRHDRRGQCVVLTNIGNIHTENHHFDRARAAYDDVIELAQAMNLRAQEGSGTGQRAILDVLQQRFGDARRGFMRAIDIAQTLNDPFREGLYLGHLGTLDVAEGHLDDARRHYDAGEAMLRDIRSHFELAQLLMRRSELDHAQGRSDDACRALQQAHDLALTMGIGDTAPLVLKITRLEKASKGAL